MVSWKPCEENQGWGSNLYQILLIIKLDKKWEMTISNVEVISEFDENISGIEWSTLAEMGLRENGKRKLGINK